MDLQLKHPVVLIDDDQEFLSVLRDQFEIHNLAYVAFDNIESALDYLSTNPAEIILSDVKMPKSSGFDLVEKILAMEFTEAAPKIILMSGFWNVHGFEAVLRGAYDYLAKPFTMDSLKDSLKKVLGSTKNYQGRRYFRLPVCIDVENEKSEQLNTMNVSVGGAFLAHVGDLPSPGTIQSLYFKFRGGQFEKLCLKAVVKWNTNSEIGDLSRGYAIEFIDMNHDVRNTLIGRLTSLLPRKWKG